MAIMGMEGMDMDMNSGMSDGSMEILEKVFDILQKDGVDMSQNYGMVRCSENGELFEDKDN